MTSYRHQTTTIAGVSSLGPSTALYLLWTCGHRYQYAKIRFKLTEFGFNSIQEIRIQDSLNLSPHRDQTIQTRAAGLRKPARVYEGLRPKLLKALSIIQERSSGSEESAGLLHMCCSIAKKTSDSKGADLCRPRIVPRCPHQLSRTWYNLTPIGYNPQLLIEDVLLLQHRERRECQWCKYGVRVFLSVSSYCYTQDDAEYDVAVCYNDRG